MSQSNGEVQPISQEKVNTNIVTLTRFLTEEQSKHKEATGDFTYGYNPTLFHEDNPLVHRANTRIQVCYAMPYNSPSSRLPTISAELL